MTQPTARPLAHLRGARPPAPAWYDAALADRPETGSALVGGATIEWRAWGSRGAPGLLLVHGGWAHAGWWSHIAPLLARERRVAALSLSGMGGSDWRAAYSIEQYADELRAVSHAAGLDAAGPPTLVGHSFGCAPVIAALADPSGWAAGGILIDGSITMKPGTRPPVTGLRTQHFADLDAALARFRLMPEQPCDNLYIVDGIARGSVTACDTGLRWSFDPTLYDRCTLIDTRATAKAIRAPLAFIRGELSAIVPPETLAGLRADLPAMRVVTIPNAHHHVMIDQPIALVTAIEDLLAG
ncbi:alpha/beta fold hydrolase [Sphingomonas prati]|uniref:Pimeloyl-ACP methyl ester carboxylesterase n=1 Tax=Sphingomonas prati TaxID=1843237 RepID=A0A7W9F3K1_9SPHN|nr:alpha/beta hydrolase [Sphingomonas prati]MBB5729605.1 pimeloyl-ACP methyl ester carboxylesterase [Sphingomonas prati]GGE76169.1 alpha/beta hydrolase [Sphingomonas prati]